MIKFSDDFYFKNLIFILKKGHMLQKINIQDFQYYFTVLLYNVSTTWQTKVPGEKKGQLAMRSNSRYCSFFVYFFLLTAKGSAMIFNSCIFHCTFIISHCESKEGNPSKYIHIIFVNIISINYTQKQPFSPF